jgi:hypothetical protein
MSLASMRFDILYNQWISKQEEMYERRNEVQGEICEICGNEYIGDYCDFCFVKCHECDKIISQEDLEEFKISNHHFYCKECFEELNLKED